MKAVQYTRYGGPEVLEVVDIERPEPKPGEVLIRLHATSINLSDLEILTGTPFYSRLFGLFRPRIHVLGSDVAGVVVAVGEEVADFKPGDAVYGDVLETFGGFAEYACAPAKRLQLMPEGLSFELAAALPQAGCIAMQGIRDKGGVKSGDRVLINGGGGGSGTLAIQIAKRLGAEVTAVDNHRKLDLMRQAGADHVLDYETTDFIKSGDRYDLILDLVATRSVFACRRALKPGGRYLMVGGRMASIFQVLILGSLMSLFSSRKSGILAMQPNRDLDQLAAMVLNGELEVFIDRRFPLEETADALQYHADGKTLGKLIVLPLEH